jgi:hypothetical protein
LCACPQQMRAEEVPRKCRSRPSLNRLQRVADAVEPESAASRWLEVSITWEPAGPVRLAGRAALEFVTDLVAGGWAGGIPAKRRSVLAVMRRDDGRTVITFDHDYEQEALDHLDSLKQRLRTMRLWDFCRDVGIAFDRVSDALPADAE